MVVTKIFRRTNSSKNVGIICILEAHVSHMLFFLHWTAYGLPRLLEKQGQEHFSQLCWLSSYITFLTIVILGINCVKPGLIVKKKLRILRKFSGIYIKNKLINSSFKKWLLITFNSFLFLKPSLCLCLCFTHTSQQQRNDSNE